MDHAVTQEKPMTKPLLAVGIDPAKRVHRAIGVLYPDTVVLDVEFPNQSRPAGIWMRGWSRWPTSMVRIWSMASKIIANTGEPSPRFSRD